MDFEMEKIDKISDLRGILFYIDRKISTGSPRVILKHVLKELAPYMGELDFARKVSENHNPEVEGSAAVCAADISVRLIKEELESYICVLARDFCNL